MSARNGRRRRLLYVSNTDWFFCTHRLSHAMAARERGWDVWIATPVTSHGDVLRETGLHVLPTRMTRAETSLWNELLGLLSVMWAVCRARASVVHLISTKPVLYGG